MNLAANPRPTTTRPVHPTISSIHVSRTCMPRITSQAPSPGPRKLRSKHDAYWSDARRSTPNTRSRSRRQRTTRCHNTSDHCSRFCSITSKALHLLTRSLQVKVLPMGVRAETPSVSRIVVTPGRTVTALFWGVHVRQPLFEMHYKILGSLNTEVGAKDVDLQPVSWAC